MSSTAARPGSSATRQIRPPPLSQHLREFVSRPEAWSVLVRNLIPVVGIYAFGWSAGLTVFNYWFDGLSAVAAILAAIVPRALRETKDKSDSVVKIAFSGVLTWVFLVGIIGLPYWMVLIPLHDLMFSANVRHELAGSQALWVTFGAIALGHVWKAFGAGYDTLPDNLLKQRLRWDVYLLMLRAVAMFMMVGFAFFLVPLMALLLTYFELWPERVLGAVFGDPTRLWEYDPETGQRAGGPKGRLP